jgi:hypothetical protein
MPAVIILCTLLVCGLSHWSRRHVRMHPELYPAQSGAASLGVEDVDTPALAELRAEASALRAEAACLREARLRTEVLELREEVARLRAPRAPPMYDAKADGLRQGSCKTWDL